MSGSHYVQIWRINWIYFVLRFNNNGEAFVRILVLVVPNQQENDNQGKYTSMIMKIEEKKQLIRYMFVQ